MLINNSSLFWVVANLNLWGNLHMQCTDKKRVSSRTNTVRERQKLNHQKHQHCLQGESIYPEQRGQKATEELCPEVQPEYIRRQLRVVPILLTSLCIRITNSMRGAS